ncbi:putative exonuclease RecB type protein [Rhizobium phage RHph_X2_26]|nr:putative exonuclease RecB type protein [Rhizobium phage RHph_X2_26]
MGQLLPPKPHKITLLIYAAYAAAQKKFDGYGIPVGGANVECDRQLWYAFRWASEQPDIEGRMLRLFDTGNKEEERLIADLARIGVKVHGQQDRMLMVSGHVRGKIDGRANNVPDHPDEEMLCEFKSSNAKNMRKLMREKVQLAKPEHYGQCQLGMHAFGYKRCLYFASCKDTDELYAEIVEYDVYFATSLLAKLERIVLRPTPPGRAFTKSEARYKCGYCKHKAICWEDDAPRRHCRTCLHARPVVADGVNDARWECGRFDKVLSFKDQAAGCANHLYIPALIPGDIVSEDRDNEAITYRIWESGELWTNKAGDSA